MGGGHQGGPQGSPVCFSHDYFKKKNEFCPHAPPPPPSDHGDFGFLPHKKPTKKTVLRGPKGCFGRVSGGGPLVRGGGRGVSSKRKRGSYGFTGILFRVKSLEFDSLPLPKKFSKLPGAGGAGDRKIYLPRRGFGFGWGKKTPPENSRRPVALRGLEPVWGPWPGRRSSRCRFQFGFLAELFILGRKNSSLRSLPPWTTQAHLVYLLYRQKPDISIKPGLRVLGGAGQQTGDIFFRVFFVAGKKKHIRGMERGGKKKPPQGPKPVTTSPKFWGKKKFESEHHGGKCSLFWAGEFFGGLLRGNLKGKKEC